MSYAEGDKVVIACPNHNEKSLLNGNTCTIKRILINERSQREMYEMRWHPEDNPRCGPSSPIWLHRLYWSDSEFKPLVTRPGIFITLDSMPDF